MNDLDDQLTATFEHLAERAPHVPDLAGVVQGRARRARRRRLAAGAAVVAVVAVAGLTGLRLLPDSGSDAGIAARTPQCAGTPTREVLPDWARTGFSDPEPVMPFVRSASGNLVAILFTDALYSPPRKDVGNKVLWVWRAQPGDLKVTARKDGTGPATTAGLPSPAGPSYVDLPSPGCWRLTITWPGGQDTVDLQAVR
jgi:hypothetical protein